MMKYTIEHIKKALRGQERELLPTLNNMGYMTATVDEYTQNFLDFCTEHPGCRVLEIGASYGIATLRALDNHARVVANDLDSRHLEILKERVKKPQLKNLTLLPGKLPDDIVLEKNSLDAILACRVLHLITGEELEKSLALFLTWLKPGGKIFIIADTPFLGAYKEFRTNYYQALERGEKWPGLISDTSFFAQNIRYNNLPPFINFLDKDTLEQVTNKAGFKIKKISYMCRSDYPQEFQFDGRESIGMIAEKL